MKNTKHYIVRNQSDEYGNCRTELVETTLKNAKEYYYYEEVAQEDIEVLKKYINFVNFEEEQEREERFY